MKACIKKKRRRRRRRKKKKIREVGNKGKYFGCVLCVVKIPP